MAFETSTRRCVLNGMLVAVAYLSLAMSFSRSFRKTTDSNGYVLCATQQPSVVYDVSQMDLPPINFDSASPPPPSALCSWKCSREPDCISFNWKVTTGECELFYSVPTECGISCDCVHYEVSVVLYNIVQYNIIQYNEMQKYSIILIQYNANDTM